MAGTLRLHLPRADLVLSVLAAVSVLAIVGVAVLVLRLQCLGGACFAVADPVATGSIGAAQAAAPSAPAFVAEVAGPSATEVTTPFAEGLITATFARLAEVPAPDTMSARPRAVVAEIPAQPVAVRRTAFAVPPPMVARMPAPDRVHTERWWWPGDADPVFPAPAPRDEPADDDNAVADIGDAELPEERGGDAAPPEPAAEPATSPGQAADDDDPSEQAAEDTARRIVAGLGVNVRAGPSKSSNTLFALRGGAEVTLTGRSERGWLELRDAQDRTGWAFGDYLLSP